LKKFDQNFFFVHFVTYLANCFTAKLELVAKGLKITEVNMKAKQMITRLTLSFIFFLPGITANTQSSHLKKTGTAEKVTKAEVKEPVLSITHHSLTLRGKILHYTAAAGYMLMKDEPGNPQASIFFIAYTLDGKPNDPRRPLTFAFNGGPGSASLWLHLGALGPKRVKMSDEGFLPPQPFQYADNEYTWLEFTDLVFIDPVSTGFSRPAPGVDKKEFHGVEEDIHSVGDFIRLYVTRNKRWLSPKFVCGESYGTTRAAGLSGYLQDTYGMYLQGVVLISSIMNFQTARFAPGNDLPYPLFLPTYTAAAWYHKKLPEQYQANLHATLKEVEQWALSDYWLALAKGDALPENERNQVIGKLAQYTGLSKKYIHEVNLRIEIYRFTYELLRDEQQQIGRLDSRFKGNFLDSDDVVFEDDPSYAALYGPFTAAINDYVRKELNYSNDLPFWPISHQTRPWNWGDGNRYVNVAETLRQAINRNKDLKVLIANGYYDLATPYFATLYTVNHMNLPVPLRNNIVMKYYEAGHMMYIRTVCRQKLRDDVEEFYSQFLK
jgi:carboxypeptidase C (cathepsin A)